MLCNYFLFQNDLKGLDQSSKMDLDFSVHFGREKTCYNQKDMVRYV